jgi:hypothetical protein
MLDLPTAGKDSRKTMDCSKDPYRKVSKAGPTVKIVSRGLEVASLDRFAVVIARSLCSVCEQIRDFVIERVVEIRRDVHLSEFLPYGRLDD